MCVTLFVVKCLAAYPIALFYDNTSLFLPICTIALIYLFYPLFVTHCALIERENRLKIIALCTAIQSTIINIVTIILALLGFGIWSIVIPMLLTIPVWLIITWKNHSWQPPRYFKLKNWQEIINFSKNILGVELLTKLRLNLDYLIVGRFLGVEQLGLYYFAFNAGSGITNNVVNLLMSALFPHLCDAKSDRQKIQKRYYKSLKTIALTVIPIVILQASLSPLYVPIVFGEKWIPAINILILVCLSVIPMTFKHAASLLLHSVDKTQISLYFDPFYTIVFAIGILISVQQRIFAVVVTVLVINLVFSSVFSVYSNKEAFGKKVKI